MQHGTCDFKREIFDPGIRKHRTITCKEPSLESNKCRFHDEEYLNENSHDVIRNEIYRKIDNACNNKKVLECVGYYIPEINIEGKKFEKEVFFSHAHFVEDVIFDHSEFDSFADFSNCVFKRETSFNNVTFNDNTEFIDSEFMENTNFKNAKFKKKADFSFSEFSEISFLAAEFDEAEFTSTTFHDDVSFTTTEFKNKTYFVNTSFKADSKFIGAKFSEEVSFSSAEFKQRAQFRKTIFLKPKQVIFDSELSHVSFLDTDITRIRLGNKIKWNIDTNYSNKVIRFYNKLKNRNNKFIIYDEWLLENEQEPQLQLEDVMDIYRNLRENYDYYLKYETAGEFFIREMELKRKYKKNKKSSSQETIKKKWYRMGSLYGIYNIVSQYGHSLYRPIYVTIPILTIFTLLFCYDNTLNPDFEKSGFQEIFNNAVFRSITSFFPFYLIDKNTDFLDITLRIILLPLSGTFFIALRRKLERKFRH